ncbi:MAG: type II CRISPR RNA-guided endonuclease Cas9 [Planctomycetota bacterium]
MPAILGLDIGSNSVGSAWVNTDTRTIKLGASIFPAGVDETDTKRGAPINQERRQARSMRRSIARRAERKRRLRSVLANAGLLPTDPKELQALFDVNPWFLRRDALERELTPHEFGRVIVHLNQRRGALGVETNPNDPDEGKVKEAIDHLQEKMIERYAPLDQHKALRGNEEFRRWATDNAITIGRYMADEMDDRRIAISGTNADYVQNPIRNRRDSFEFHADRALVRAEFARVWEKQRSFDGPLAQLLTDELRLELDAPGGDQTWRQKGAIFGQRQTYWNTGTLGRCDLEPTDHRCSIHDMHAQHFRVIETVNNIRIQRRGQRSDEGLMPEQRDLVIAALRRQKTGSIATIRKALGIDKARLKKQDLSEDYYTLNIERDEQREINTDRFYREIVHGVFGEEQWLAMTPRQRESVNRALLKFDKDTDGHTDRLKSGAQAWWGLDESNALKLVDAWKACGRSDKRLRMSRQAIINILPYMKKHDADNDRWPTQIEAKQMFAEDPDSGATPEQRIRYAHSLTDKLCDIILKQVGGEVGEYERLLRLRDSTRKERHYLARHPEELLPPAPMLANPVVRKAIHEVRRHVIAYLREFGGPPDRVMIELARQARQSERVRDATLARNRNREAIRKRITSEYDLAGLTPNQQRTAQERVILCRQQRRVCAYTGKSITDRQAALGQTDDGRRLEIDHIVPYSRCGDNSLNNKVLCYVEQNRGKSSKTPCEWWGDQFDERIQPLAFMDGFKPDRTDYFTKRDYARKWDNLTREIRPEDEWKSSQLTDTAYAARQVMAYLRDTLFAGRQDRDHGVFETNGRYTAILRRDWGLVGEEGKSRDDHRHHAIDALVIALTHPRDLLPKLARSEYEREEYHDRTGYWPKRTPSPPPWPPIPKDADEEQREKAVAEFRAPIMRERENLIVSHRPVKRRLVGAFHKETLFGTIPQDDQQFTCRKSVEALKPGYLKLPRPETEKEAIARLTNRYLRLQSGLTKKAVAKKARMAVRSTGYIPKIVDPAPDGNSFLVRDVDLRRRLRACIDEWCTEAGNGRDADSFTDKDVKEMAKIGRFRQVSKVPIKSVVLKRTMADPIVIARKRWDAATGTMKPEMNPNDPTDPHPITRRVYEGRNNHHIEVRENESGEWSGLIVDAFTAVGRNAARLRAWKAAGVPTAKTLRNLTESDRKKHNAITARINAEHPIVDRADNDDGQFVMSLAEGETVHMRHPKTDESSYFVVFKLDKPHKVHFQHHLDARRDSGRKDEDNKMIPGSKREDIAVTAADLKRKCSFADGTPPYKVRVSPLGKVRKLEKD